MKVFLTGPPCSGKSYFGKKLSEMYGVPHIVVKDVISSCIKLENSYGDFLRKKIEELKD